ncbi:MAG: hypothetical protein M0Q90_03225 [Bacteroidales bacterium]|nr:hypothetical protein [Bacteroidales bacterium]
MIKILISLGMSLLFLTYGCSDKTPDSYFESGVSEDLAAMRTDQIANINYLLFVNLPENRSQKIDASLVLEFFMSEVSQPVILDFHPDESYLLSVFHKGESIAYTYKNGHILIDKKHFKAGQQQLEFHFILPEDALSANENYQVLRPFAQHDFLGFPAFKQTDLPASFLLNMEIPASFKALSNAPILKETQVSDRLSVAFAKTSIMATDAFSFVAGRLYKIEEKYGEKTPAIYYAGNEIPDSNQLIRYASKIALQDTASVSQFDFSGKTDLVILTDLELPKTFYLPGLVYVSRE